MTTGFRYDGWCERLGILRLFRHVRVATKGAHCRPPGPPASLSLFAGTAGAPLPMVGIRQPDGAAKAMTPASTEHL
jgi:hypothetical protein